jgi:signal transduction histidine kinase
MPNRPATFRYRVYNGLLLLSVVVIMGTSILSLRTTGQLQQSVARASHTELVIAQLIYLWGLLGDSESNGLRYVLVGDERFQVAFRTNLDELSKSLEDLAVLTSDNPAQVREVARLRDLVMQRAHLGTTTLQLKADEIAGAAGAARELRERLRSGEGHRILMELRVVVDDMLARERELLVQRNDQRNQMIQQNWATVLIANSLALVAGLVGYSATRRMQRKALEAFRSELQADQARRSSQDKSIFLASMSHEIRTPMNAIFGFTNLLEERVTDPTQADYVASIKKSGQALLSLINDVLDLSKIEAGQLEVRRAPFDLREVVERVAASVRPLTEPKGLTLRVVVPPGLAALVSDRRRVEQIVLNLLHNAIKFTDRGEVTCEVSVEPGRGALRIVVRDTGIGLKPEDLGKLFQPFRQIDSGLQRQHEGTGLGLAISRRLAGLLGGRIHASSVFGQGSTFTVELPHDDEGTR